MIKCRNYNTDDYDFLREMLFEAVFWSRSEDDLPSLEEGLSYDYTKHILEDFGARKGDIAVIAEASGIRAGAVFIRYFNKDLNVRGYISDDIPVLVIGVKKEYRVLGLGTELIEYLKYECIKHGIDKISLCVTKSNIAYGLYINQGFKVVEDIDSSYNMLWEADV